MPVKPTILVIDDEKACLASLQKVFENEGYEVLLADNGPAGIDLLRARNVNVILTDLMMPAMDGLGVLKAGRSLAPEVEVILMTAYGTVEKAVEAMKEGAYDFITKPLKRIYVLKAVRRACEKQALVMENRSLRAKLDAADQSRMLVGRSAAMAAMFETIRQAAPSSATVLVKGESGTGKELVARAIHKLSPRAAGPFIAVNCAAIPEGILESELFGYEKGAFTGATARKEGRFELAHGGTLLLDEVGEMSASAQVKLLRVLEEGAFERLGGTQTIRVDIRVVAATQKDLVQEIAAGRFREDLFYRLNVITIRVPPLRDRAEDIPLLVEHFIRLYSEKNAKSISGITRAAMDTIEAHNWPGNVRELENAIERAVVLCRGNIITPGDLPENLQPKGERGRSSLTFPIGTPLDEIERLAVVETLKFTKGDKSLAARLLGIAPRTIYRKLEEWGIGG